jgi:acyl-CoA thioester hydrolase
MTEPPTLWQGTANAWECDEMGHMNVRHYLAKAEDALAGLFADHAVPPRAIAAQHVRYHRETRAGTPLLIRGAAISTEPGNQLYFEVVSPFDATVRATILLTLEGPAPAPGRQLPLPPHAAPRGLPLTPPHANPTLAAAEAAGLREITRCVIRREHTDEAGLLRPHQVAGLISDGVAHLMMHVTPDRGSGNTEGGTGGAALEQRIIHRAPARAGDHVSARSGIMEAGEKTMRVVHWLLNHQTGQAIATCEVIAVAFNLTTRRAVALPPDVRARIAGMAVGVGA